MAECMYKKDCADYPERCKDCANDPGRSYFVPKQDYPCPTPYIPYIPPYTPWYPGTGDWWYYPPYYTVTCGSSCDIENCYFDDD
uniref:Uncharacterized protein n=1 Tax=viral metagenome TaxID=1070528 RepID=A0A6M3K6B5_9ZZZZ